MQIAAAVLKRQQAVLVLVPEIALITQMERRFRARFGERIAVLHSGLSAGERFDRGMLGHDVERGTVGLPFEHQEDGRLPASDPRGHPR